jgi:hypothetical protein
MEMWKPCASTCHALTDGARAGLPELADFFRQRGDRPEALTQPHDVLGARTVADAPTLS